MSRSSGLEVARSFLGKGPDRLGIACFSVLHRYFGFHKLKVCDNPTLSDDSIF